MFSDEKNKLDTYLYVRTKLIILKKKCKSLSEPIHFKIFPFFSLWSNKKGKNFFYIYIEFFGIFWGNSLSYPAIKYDSWVWK